MSFQVEAQSSPWFCPSVQLYKWRSARTGLQVVLIKRASPSVQGNFVVATEANDNSGCPHTLEHLVFRGSKKYPYCGFLDILSAKQTCETNAWTAQDHTCYTLSSAGHEGFLRILPVYLDHILNATITDSDCITEVYHIDGNGEEKGVVFSEMQSYENDPSTLVGNEIKRLLYANNSGYATDTGGKLDALRVLKTETIREYHRSSYRPSNLSVIVTGDVEPEELLIHMEQIDKELPSETHYERPFLESELSMQKSPLVETTRTSIKFPDDDESSARLCLGWMGPPISDLLSCLAIDIIQLYLCMKDIGKLNQQFVNVPKEQALASGIYLSSESYLTTQIELQASGVPSSRLEELNERIIQYLHEEFLNEFDFGFISQCIENFYDSFIMNAENSWETFIEMAITEFIYGSRNSFSKWMSDVADFDTLRSWSEQDWSEFIKKWLTIPPKACVLAYPSKDTASVVEELKKQNSEDIKHSKNLEECRELVEWAIKNNEEPVPKAILTQFSAPDVTKVKFVETQTAATQNLMNNLPGESLNLHLPTQELVEPSTLSNLALNFENIASQFITIKLYFSLGEVDNRLLPLIDSIFNSLFALPMKLDNGDILSAEQVAKETRLDLLEMQFGADEQMSEMATMLVMAKAENYTKALKWIENAIFNVQFDPSYIEMLLSKELKKIRVWKRDDSTVLHSYIDETLLTEDSLSRQVDPLISEPLIKEFEQNINRTVADLETLRSQLFKKNNIRGVIVGNMDKLADLCGGNVLEPWGHLETRLTGSASLLNPIDFSRVFLSEKGRSLGKEAFIIEKASADSTYMRSICPGPNRYGHEDLPALTLVKSWLEMAEGPYWTAVRGNGLAYNARSTINVQTGQILLHIDQAADLVGAFNACKNVINDIVAGKLVITQDDLSRAASLVLSRLSEALAQPVGAATEKFVDTVLKGYCPDYVHKILQEIQDVTIDVFVKTIERYHSPIFDVSKSSIFVVAPTGEISKIKDELEKLGYQTTVKKIDTDTYDESDDDDSDDSDDGSSFDDSFESE